MANKYTVADWADVDGTREWPYLLVGNGASSAVSSKFSYRSLLNAANLTDDEREIFKALATVNFEAVLDYLRVAAQICEQVGHDETDVLDRYESIKKSLIEAINDHHADWSSIPTATLETYRSVLLSHSATWSTSYDLLSYWAVMADRPYRNKRIGDCFWNQGSSFDPANTIPAPTSMPMLYWPHGALHLYRTQNGQTVKRSHEPGRNLLELLGKPFKGADLPLFVSEGTSARKTRVIRSSEYLSHAYTTLAESKGSLVVFGQAFGSMDAHLVAAIQNDPRRHIAYAVYADNSKDANLICANVEKLFPRARIAFFDSTTHPLG